jgi:hypothetical protein
VLSLVAEACNCKIGNCVLQTEFWGFHCSKNFLDMTPCYKKLQRSKFATFGVYVHNTQGFQPKSGWLWFSMRINYLRFQVLNPGDGRNKFLNNTTWHHNSDHNWVTKNRKETSGKYVSSQTEYTFPAFFIYFCASNFFSLLRVVPCHAVLESHLAVPEFIKRT